jgi:hypothetical protein
MNSNSKWFKAVIYVMIGSMVLSTVAYTVGILFY